jgi:hypothetical protein
MILALANFLAKGQSVSDTNTGLNAMNRLEGGATTRVKNTALAQRHR